MKILYFLSNSIKMTFLDIPRDVFRYKILQYFNDDSFPLRHILAKTTSKQDKIYKDIVDMAKGVTFNDFRKLTTEKYQSEDDIVEIINLKHSELVFYDYNNYLTLVFFYVFINPDYQDIIRIHRHDLS